MSEKSFHHEPSGSDCKNVYIKCESEERSLISVLLVLGWIIVPVIIFVIYYFWPNDCFLCDEELVKKEVTECAKLGPLHDERRIDEGLGVPHPPGTCRDIKEIIDDSIDHYAIADAVCTTCGPDPDAGPVPNREGEFPLALGGPGVLIEIEDWPLGGGGGPVTETAEGCMAPVVGIEVDSLLTGADPRRSKTKYQETDLDLPPFCNINANNPSAEVWSLLDRPRVHFTRTFDKQQLLNPPPPGQPVQPDEVNKPFQVGAPYAVFVARQAKNHNLVKVFFLYVDFVSERPTIVEIPFETLIGRKAAIGNDSKVHLINNLKLDSINREITFQVGFGVEEIAIAGYDFGPKATDGQAIARRNVDASGSYVVCLSDTGGVERVYRVDDAGPGCSKARRRR